MKKRTSIYYLTFLVFLTFGSLIYYRIDFKQFKNRPGDTFAKQVPYDVAKADNPDKFVEYHNDLRTRASEISPGYSSGYKLNELKKARQEGNFARLSATYEFTERGPANVPGRTRGLIADPDDATHGTWFAGGVGGGIWKTTNAGKNWINKTPDVPNMAISWLVMAESDHNIIYAGTGEGFVGAIGIKGSGIYKSTDKGESWALLPSTIQNDDFQMVNRIVVDPLNADIILVATSNDGRNAATFNSGILKSIDGGLNWTRKFTGPSWVQQIVASPDDFNILYATVHSNGVYKSTDAGETWSSSSTGLNADGRAEMAVSPVNTARLYVSVQGSYSGNGSDLYVSDDAGATWNVTTEETTGEDVDFLGGQGGYDNTIMAHPYNEDVVYVGAVNLWKFSMKTGSVTSKNQFVGAQEDNTKGFISLLGFASGVYYGGKIAVGSEPKENYVSIEIRYGPDGNGGHLKQFAHRYTVPEGEGSGVPAINYSYQDYVEVPFEVWDITNNRQLMIAFRDQQRDGKFNLLPLNTDNADAENNSREYLYMNNIAYNATVPDPGMAVDGGHEFKNLYYYWPYLPQGGVWDETNLPAAKFVINFADIEKRLKNTTSIADAYTEFGGNNSFSQQMGITAMLGVHPDHHNIVPLLWPEEGQKFQLLIANDGGIYVSDLSEVPGEADISISIAGLTYNTSQFYAADKAANVNEYIGGMQDNGTWMSVPGQEGSATANFKRAGTGDGFGCAWNHADPNLIIATSQYGNINKSRDRGGSFSKALSGITDTGAGKAPFVSEIENLHSNPNVVYTATVSGVWRSTNFADNWQLSTIPSQWSLGLAIKVRISQANSHIVWAGNAMRETPSIASLHVSTDEGVSFSPVNNYTDRELGSLSGLATHPMLDSTAFALFSFAKGPKILRTDNLGESWYDISGFGTGTSSSNGFPDVALYDLLVMPYDTTIIWAGTEIGIFESTDAGGTWHILNGNMPATSIWDMKIVDDQVVIGTYGRGIWSVTINDLPGHVYVPEIILGLPSLAGELLLDVRSSVEFDSSHIFVDGVLSNRIIQPATIGVKTIETNYFPTATSGKAYIRSFFKGVPYVSQYFDYSLFDYGVAIDSYENNFNTVNDDFFSRQLVNREYANFESRAIHSPHNYVKNAYYLYMLKTPIRVKSANALINFQEVALVEPGIDGSLPGSDDFNDYVVVQGSLDGVTWKNLLDEYDASSNDDWHTTYTRKSPGYGSMFKFRAIDLLNTFAANDEILIRFLLIANATNEGWGWAFDNLKIQTESVITGLESEIPITSFSVYPNPVTSNTVTVYHDRIRAQGQISLFNLNGQLLLSKPVSNSDKTQVELPAILRNGIYSFIITSGIKSETHKIIIQRNL